MIKVKWALIIKLFQDLKEEWLENILQIIRLFKEEQEDNDLMKTTLVLLCACLFNKDTWSDKYMLVNSMF